MMPKCSCHCEATNLVCDTCCLEIKIVPLILCLENDIKIINREVVYSSFLCISVFILFFFLSVPRQSITKNYLSDFHQEGLLTNIFTSTRSLYFCVLFVCQSVCFLVLIFFQN